MTEAARNVPSLGLVVYDTTVRNGAGTEEVAFSMEDKRRILKALDELGVVYVEMDWFGANLRDHNVFKMARGGYGSSIPSLRSMRHSGDLL